MINNEIKIQIQEHGQELISTRRKLHSNPILKPIELYANQITSTYRVIAKTTYIRG